MASENRSLQLKIRELEHVSDASHEELSHESDESDDSSEEEASEEKVDKK